jgi:hypothetical protein
MSWAQVWDIPPIVMAKVVAYLLPRRHCGCGRMTTAALPCGAAGNVTYGPCLFPRPGRLGSPEDNGMSKRRRLTE